MKDSWEREATHPAEYHSVECDRGREFIIRLTTGADVYKAIQQFAKDKGIKFGKIHAAFMGGFSPAKMFMWCPDPHDPDNWHNESAASFENLSMLDSDGLVSPALGDEYDTFGIVTPVHEPFGPTIHVNPSLNFMVTDSRPNDLKPLHTSFSM